MVSSVCASRVRCAPPRSLLPYHDGVSREIKESVLSPFVGLIVPPMGGVPGQGKEIKSVQRIPASLRPRGNRRRVPQELCGSTHACVSRS